MNGTGGDLVGLNLCRGSSETFFHRSGQKDDGGNENGGNHGNGDQNRPDHSAPPHFLILVQGFK